MVLGLNPEPHACTQQEQLGSNGKQYMQEGLGSCCSLESNNCPVALLRLSPAWSGGLVETGRLRLTLDPFYFLFKVRLAYRMAYGWITVVMVLRKCHQAPRVFPLNQPHSQSLHVTGSEAWCEGTVTDVCVWGGATAPKLLF